MKQSILDALKAKYPGVSEKILSRIADKLAKTVTKAEDVQTAVDGVTFQQVLESYGDSRATEAQQTAVKNYEKTYGLKDGKKVDADTKGDEGKIEVSEDIPSWAKAVIESNKTLVEEVKAIKNEKLTANRRDQLSKIISVLPESIRKSYERTPVDNLTDEEFETLKTDVTNEVADITKVTRAKDAVFGQPTFQGGSKTQQTSGGDKEATDDEAKTVVDKLGI